MAYDPSNLSALAYANGFTMWHYRTTDLATEVESVGYFDDASNQLRVGDFIIGNTNIGIVRNGAAGYGISVVTANAGGNVGVVPLMAGTLAAVVRDGFPARKEAFLARLQRGDCDHLTNTALALEVTGEASERDLLAAAEARVTRRSMLVNAITGANKYQRSEGKSAAELVEMIA